MACKLTASSAVLAIIAAGAIGTADAQMDSFDPLAPPPAAVSPDVGVGLDAASPQGLVPMSPTLVTAFIGASVYPGSEPDAASIGGVNDLIVAEDGAITHAVIGVGGFLGIGQKDVAVPFDELELVVQDGDVSFIYFSTREQLEQAPEFDRTAYDPSERDSMEPGAFDTGLFDQPVTEPIAPTEPPATTGSLDLPPAEPGADLSAQPADTMTAESDLMMSPSSEIPATGDVSQPTEFAQTDVPGNAMTSAQHAAAAAFVTPDATQIRARSLLGREVHGSDDQVIGQVSDLVLAEDGTGAALIDIGGFLGIASREVAIPFHQIEVSQDLMQGEESKLRVAMTAQELQQLPEYVDPSQEMAAADGMHGAPAADAGPTSDQLADGGDMSAAPGADSIAPSGMLLTTANFSAERMLGMPVLGTDQTSIGEVHDILFDANGDIRAVVIDVGGFLGIGEKPVAVSFESIRFQQQEDAQVALVVNATPDQLQGAPTYEPTVPIDGQTVQ